jgi:hypothetical protein
MPATPDMWKVDFKVNIGRMRLKASSRQKARPYMKDKLNTKRGEKGVWFNL